jgi:uncharacterized protein (DUF58 family)
MDILYLLSALALLLWLQSFLFRRWGLSRLRYTRAFSRKAAFAGETVEIVEVLRNAKPLPMPWLRAESRMSPALRFAGRAQEGMLHEIAGDAFHRSVFFLAPFSQVTRRQRVTLLQRGRYEVGSVALTMGDLFGFSQSTRQMDTGAAITVYPQPLSLDQLDIPSSRWQGDLLVKRWIVPDPFLVAGIREWQPGDARRDVHWGATARTGRLQVKAHDYTASPKLLVLLNVQKQERQWGDLMDYEQAAVERGISLAAALCLRALRAGLDAGFAANAPMGADLSLSTLLLPAHYAGREEDLLEAIARLKIIRTKNFHTFLDDLGQLSGLDIMILSAYDSPLLQERIALLRLRGNSVALLPLPGEVAA